MGKERLFALHDQERAELSTAADFTNRLIAKISCLGGHVFYVGLRKEQNSDLHRSQKMYLAVLRETVVRLDSLHQHNDQRPNFLMIMDEHQEHDAIITAVAQTMFAKGLPRRRLIEPPFQVTSHRYQTIQAADWLCGLIGRLGAFQTGLPEFAEYDWAERYFGTRIRQASIASGVKMEKHLPAVLDIDAAAEPEE